MARPSAYLAGKCECLAKVIDFFASNNGGYCRTVKDKRTVFLSQIDFWDWEMDELIFSMQNFTERSQAWESVATIRASLSKLGLPIDPSVLHKIESDRGWNIYALGNNQVDAPDEVLNKIIQKWNKLLKLCEDTLLMEKKDIAGAVSMGCQIVSNLDKYRKKERE